MSDKKDIQSLIIRILRTPEEGMNGRELAVMQYVVGGQAYSPELVNREVYFDKIDRKKKYGKTKGLKWADVHFIASHSADILNLIAQRTPAPKQIVSGQEAASGDDSNSER